MQSKTVRYLRTDKGVFVSTDGGTEWARKTNAMDSTDVWALAVLDSDLFAGTSGGIFLSTDNGTSWTNVSTGLPTDDGCWALATLGSDIFDATFGSGVFISTNNGSTWAQANTGLINTSPNALATAGSNLFVATSGGVFVSTNNGAVWTEVDSGLFRLSISSLTVLGTNLYAGTSDGTVWLRPISEMVSSANNRSEGMIAHYPMDINASDTTWNFDPMTLNNTPFKDGGVYCNGVYRDGQTSNWCNAETPVLPDSIFKSFTVSVKFKVDSPPASDGFLFGRPLIVGGDDYRWIGCNLMPDTTVLLFFNNGGLTLSGELVNLIPSKQHFALNTWQEITISYDSSDSIGKLYLNGTFACSGSLHLIHGAAHDRTFSITNYGNGGVFKGLLKDLEIYSTVLTPTEVRSSHIGVPAAFQLDQNYPNPFNPSTTINYRLPMNTFVTLKVFDILGRKVETLIDERQTVGTHSVQFSALNLPSGVYFYRLQAGTYHDTKKLLLLK